MKNQIPIFNIAYVESLDDFNYFPKNSFLIETDLNVDDRILVINSVYDQIGAKMRTENWDGFYDIMKSHSFWGINTANKEIFWIISGLTNKKNKGKDWHLHMLDILLSVSQRNSIKIILMP